jgi:hypothetical protein
MTIDELIKTKRALEIKIKELLTDFERDTGVYVEAVDIRREGVVKSRTIKPPVSSVGVTLQLKD